MTRTARPAVAVPTGEHTRTEVLVRITTKDGRITDHGPYLADLQGGLGIAGLSWRREPGSVVTYLERIVTTVATEWQPKAPASGDAR